MALKLSARPASSLSKLIPDQIAGVQRIGGLVEIPALLRELGIDPADAFRQAGLRVLDFANTEARVPYADIGRLLGVCAVVTKQEHLGLLVGARWRLAHLGIIGELMRYAPTVGAALRIGAAYQWLNAAGGVPFVIERPRSVEVGYGIYLNGVPHPEQLHDLALAFEAQVIRELCGASWKPSRVMLPRSEPIDTVPYSRLFNAPIQFDADYAAMQFPASVLARKLRNANPAKVNELERHVAALGPEELVPRLRRAIRVMLAFGDTSGDDLAAMLAMHRRTLNRRLAEGGTSFQALLDEVRFAVARQLLEKTRLPLAEIANALGYAESSPFVRAFCRWSGMTPTSWRTSKSVRQRRLS